MEQTVENGLGRRHDTVFRTYPLELFLCCTLIGVVEVTKTVPTRKDGLWKGPTPALTQTSIVQTTHIHMNADPNHNR